MRHEIGIETISFGRDYPHTESTWPNTQVYLQQLLAGVPVEEARLILGENLARFLDLDRSRLAPIVDRIGFSVEDVLGAAPDIDPDLLTHFDARCGLSKPAEGASRLDQVESMLNEDLERVGAR